MKAITKRIMAIMLATVMLFSVMPISAIASEDEATITIESSVEGVYGVDYTYEIMLNSQPYNGNAIGSDEWTYKVRDGVLIIPSDVSVDITVPVGTEYIVKRLELVDEYYGTIPETETKSGVISREFTYYKTFGSTTDEVTEQEFNSATNNGTNLTATVYVDDAYNVYPSADVESLTVYSPTNDGGTSTVTASKSSVTTYSSKLTYKTKYIENLTTTGRCQYDYSANLTVNNFTLGDYASNSNSVKNVSINVAKGLCVTALNTVTTTMIGNAVNDITKATSKAVSLGSNPYASVPKSDELPDVDNKEATKTNSFNIIAYTPVESATVTYEKLDLGANAHLFFDGEASNVEKEPELLELDFGTIPLDAVDNITYYIEVNGEALNDVVIDENGEDHIAVNGAVTLPSNVMACIFVEEGSSYSIRVLEYNGDKLPKFGETKPVTGIMTAETYTRTVGGVTEIITKEEYDAETNNGKDEFFEVYIDKDNKECDPSKVAKYLGYTVEKNIVNEQEVLSFNEVEYACRVDDVKTTPISYSLKANCTKTAGAIPSLTRLDYTADMSVSVKDYTPAGISTTSKLTAVSATPNIAKAALRTSAAAAITQLTKDVVFDSFAKSTTKTVMLSENPTAQLPETSDIPDTSFACDITTTNILELEPLALDIKMYDVSNDARYVEISMDPEGHSFTNYVENNDGVNASCQFVGRSASKTAKCDFCSATNTIVGNELEKLNHTPMSAKKENVVSATCTKAGSYDMVVRCKDCNKIISSTTTPVSKLAHSYTVTKKAYKAPTCTENGNKALMQCKTCTATTGGESIPATGHKIVVDKAVKATYAKAGKTEGKHCSVCKTVTVKQKSVAKLTPPAIKFSKTSGAKKAIKLSWKKNTKATRYEIRYSTDKKMKSAKTVKVAKNSTTSTTIKKLSAKKTYYVQIRTVVVENKKSYPSAWSKAVSVKTK